MERYLHAPKKITIKNIDKKVINFALNQTLIDFIDWLLCIIWCQEDLLLRCASGMEKIFVRIQMNMSLKKKIEIINYSLNQEQKNLKFLENNSKNFVFQFTKALTGSGKRLFTSSE